MNMLLRDIRGITAVFLVIFFILLMFIPIIFVLLVDFLTNTVNRYILRHKSLSEINLLFPFMDMCVVKPSRWIHNLLDYEL